MAHAVTVTSPFGPNVLVFQSLTGREELGRLFEFKLELLSENGALALDTILGQNITIKAKFTDDRERFFNGDVVMFRQLAKVQDRFFCYEAILRPQLWYLSRTADCKIFQNLSVPDIIFAILDEVGITNRRRSLSGTYAAREYCVQYNESDFDFISRLMEESGIYYYFEHEDQKHTLVLADSFSAHPTLAPDTLPFRDLKQGYNEDTVYDWTLLREVESGKWTHRDFDFVTPLADKTALSEISRSHGHPSMEVFAYPGGYTVTADGTTIARTRIEELQVPWERIEGASNAQLMASGVLFTLEGFAREDQNRQHLVVAAEFDIRMEVDTAAAADTDVLDSKAGVTFDCKFEAIDGSRPFRTACTTPKPLVKGPQTAMVVGKAGEEIWTDEYGRVKVQFHWDRIGTKDENSSCWLRVAQFWAGQKWGAIHIPRIGQEVIVDFLEGDPDQPIITGRVYNADHVVPYALPANQTQSGLKTRSTKTGTETTFNELRFEDLKGSEQIFFHAEKNFDREVENNDTLMVGFQKDDQGNKQAAPSKESAGGDQTIDIFNNRTVTLEEGIDKLQVKKGNRIGLVDKGHDELTIGEGNQTITISKGNQTVTITQGDMTIKIEAGKGLIEAATELTLKVGESSITIKPSEIAIASVNVKITADGNFEATGAQSKVTGSGALDLNGGTITLN